MRYYTFIRLTITATSSRLLLVAGKSTKQTAVELFTLIKHTNMHTGIKITICIHNMKIRVACACETTG